MRSPKPKLKGFIRIQTLVPFSMFSVTYQNLNMHFLNAILSDMDRYYFFYISWIYYIENRENAYSNFDMLESTLNGTNV